MCALVFEPPALRRNMSYIISVLILYSLLIDVEFNVCVYIRSERVKRAHSLYQLKSEDFQVTDFSKTASFKR